ncbi:hypothetical protein L596_010276 [Steinernema carpocapsae]|uniref:Uncharacterized protein n=1 Tax=Steinernema carpocapsae TaxID=34508 RepID=A0A4U5PHV2_STECR|nr:hypothetical protein L596_010276 [Steinernema carpocapsae]
MSAKWTYAPIVVSILYGIGTYVLGRLLTLQEINLEVPAMCYTYDSVRFEVAKSLHYVRIAFIAISILLYIPIFLKLYKQAKANTSTSNSSFKLLRRTSITVAVATCTDLLLLLIPDLVLATDFLGSTKYAVLLFVLNAIACAVRCM